MSRYVSYHDKDDITAGIPTLAQRDTILGKVIARLKTTPKEVSSGSHRCTCGRSGGEYDPCLCPGPSYASNWEYDKLKRQIKELLHMRFCACGSHLPSTFSFCSSCGTNRGSDSGTYGRHTKIGRAHV